MRMALDRVANLHSSKLTDYKRLLSAATSQAAQENLERSRHPTQEHKDARPFKFDINSLSAQVHALTRDERFELLDLILQSLYGSDVLAMKRHLDHTIKSTRDIIGSLPVPLAARILSELDAPDLIQCRLVCRQYDKLISNPEESSHVDIWRALCYRLTRFDAVRPKPRMPDAWFELYKGLHNLARNWQLGRAQGITQLKGHTAHVTSLKKHGDVLITGSYDCSIRVWNLQTNKCTKTIQCGKSISCIDYMPEFGVVAAGCHAIGTIYIISATSGEVLATLSGHNKGISNITTSKHYVVSAGMDKAIVVWNLETGKKVVRFGSQTNLSLVGFYRT